MPHSPHPGSFAGNTKVGRSILHEPEQRFIKWAVPRIPHFINSVHLTVATIPWSLGLVLFGLLAVEDIRWLWGASAMIALQWLTDSLDGSLGRARKSGLFRWGYYMDHLLDYFFYASIMVCYATLLPVESLWLFLVIFGLVTGFMINAHLSMAASDEFRIAYFGIGPTEIRILLILMNTFLIVFGKEYLNAALPTLLVIAFVGLIVVIYGEHKKIWAIDQRAKK